MDKDKGSRDADGAVASGSDSTSKEKKKHEEKKRDKKARKKETASSSLLNPADDAELTDKARGALSYAHTRLSASDGWKFNKAHQNWIVKHVFSCNDIPEKYFPVVTAYLSGCQGGVRDNLVQNCSKQLDASPEVCSAPDSTPTPVPAPSALTEDTEAEPLKLASKIPSPATQEAIKARARTLLEVLGSSSSQD
ncbi:hypothetical protein DFH11DRAFT_340915 [Phellopilus nigrolimitatus]|nr:hypothetical protein DFH11DRAFT_340915 [Phellopilus nigrolimitatus]